MRSSGLPMRIVVALDGAGGHPAAWNVVTSWDAFTGENFRRGGFLPRDQRYERAKTFPRTAWELFGSWHGGEILADRDSGMFLADPDAGRFAHHDTYFEIAGHAVTPPPSSRPPAMP